MVKISQDDSMYAANKRVLVYTVTDEDTSTPLNMSTYTVKWAMSRIDSEGNFLTSPVLEKTEASGIAISGDDSEIASVTIETADTSNTLTGDFYTELEVTDSSSESVVVATGTLTILRNVENT